MMASQVHGHTLGANTWMSLILMVCITAAWAQNEQLLRKAETLYNQRLPFENLRKSRQLIPKGLRYQNYRTLIFSDFDENLYVGGKEELLQVDPNDLSITGNITVATTSSASATCGTGPECNNFVRLVQPLTDTELFVCGTDAKDPKCYFANTGAMTLTPADASFSANYMVPSEPYQNSSWLYVDQVDELFMTTGAGSTRSRTDYNFASVDLTAPFDDAVDADVTPDVLLSPDFVGEPIEHKDRIFFFFRELAFEHINGGRIIFSRVGSVCKNDSGGEAFTQLVDEFTTYQKARLSCSLTEDDLEFNYNELQDVYQVNSTIFAVFTTPRSSPASSAVCAYDLDEILAIFQDDQYKGQANNGELWTQVATSAIPADVFQCGVVPVVGSYIFIRDYPLKSRLVPNKLYYHLPSSDSRESDAPLLVMDDVRFSQIVVDKDVNGVDVMFLGTERGTIIKAYLTEDKSAALLVEEIDIDEDRTDGFQAPIVTMLKRGDFIYAGTDMNLYKVPLESCANKTKCECQCSQDPYCVLSGETCERGTGSSSGASPQCPCTEEAYGTINVVRHHPCENSRDRQSTDPCQVSVLQNKTAHLNFAAYAPQDISLSAGNVECDCPDSQPEVFVSNSVCNGRRFLTVSAAVNVTDDCNCRLVFSSGADTNRTLETRIVKDITDRVINTDCKTEASKYDEKISFYKVELRRVMREMIAKYCQTDYMYVCDNCPDVTIVN